LNLRSIEAYYTTIINIYPLNEIDLTIWGYLLYNLGKSKRERIPYTCLEIVFKVGSQVIRQSLYKISELGLIRYFARGHKEFLQTSNQAIKKVEILLEKKYRQTRESENGLLLQCPRCLETIDYLSCFDDMDFRCPSCEELMQIITNKEKSSHELRKLTRFINSVLEEGRGKKIQRIMTSTIKTRK
jgi:transcription initiation factor IIE alpha subunit